MGLSREEVKRTSVLQVCVLIQGLDLKASLVRVLHEDFSPKWLLLSNKGNKKHHMGITSQPSHLSVIKERKIMVKNIYID